MPMTTSFMWVTMSVSAAILEKSFFPVAHLEVDCPSHLIRDADVLRRKGISVTRISAFAKPEDTQRFVCKHPNLIKQVEKGTNMFDVFVFPIDCITRIRAGEKVLWTNPTT